jgi:signal transduction histidine kinase
LLPQALVSKVSITAINHKPRLTAGIVVQLILLYATGTGISVFVGNIDNSLLLYLPAALSILFIHWYGLPALPIIYLNSLLTIILWKAKGSMGWYLLMASHEPAVAFTSWLLARHLLNERGGFKDVITFSKFIILGIAIPGAVNCFYTYHYSFIKGDLDKVFLLWIADFITMYCIAIPAFHFFKLSWPGRFFFITSKISLRFLKKMFRYLLLLVGFFMSFNLWLDFKEYWFIYGICSIALALRWGFAMAITSNFILFTLSYLMPLLLQAGDVRLIQPSSQQISVHVGMATMFIVSALIGRAVSDSRLKEKELQQQKKRLEGINDQLRKTNHDLDRFVYSVSHDISAPLKSIKGLVSLFSLDGSANSPSAKDYLDKINISVSKLENFIGEVLDHSRSSRKEIKLEDINLESFFQDVLDNLKYIDNFSRIQFQFKLQVSTLKSDSFLLRVIVSNMISNAIKYQKRYNDHLPEVTISSEMEKGKLAIRISDNGEGIAESNQAKVFEMFYRGSMSSSGSGLGLYIAREAAERLKGTIQFESTYGQGSTFKLLLPV